MMPILIFLLCLTFAEKYVLVLTQITGVRIRGDSNFGPITAAYIRDDARVHATPVCFEGYQIARNWSNNEATVACRQAGYKFGWAEKYSNTKPLFYRIVNTRCEGDEESLEDCTYEQLRNNDGSGCGTLGAAGVRCFNILSEKYFNETTGVIESQNYPSHYPNATGLTYIIEVQNTIKLTIVFASCRLQYGDYLYYGTGTVPRSLPLADGSFTDIQEPPVPFEVSGNSMWFRFMTDLERTDNGFSFKYEASAPVTDQPDIILSTSESAMDERSTGIQPSAVVGISVAVAGIVLVSAILGVFIYIKRRRVQTLMDQPLL
ncbi:scavenger receptor cysteine-rich domain-containing protein DMBT1-like isoform X2 [Amphiura filiformis]|uniref:scavenger receptor cysteine-rich domain-containing protein DMBT1-like isoform X2 n=1 Tax=Amphiura filiformis TaxID=82378 RepID=UPI003B21FB77